MKRVKWKHSSRDQKGIAIFLFSQCTQQKEVLIIKPTPGLQEQEREREEMVFQVGGLFRLSCL